MINIIIIGAGGHAKACIDVIESTKRFKIKGIVKKDNKEITKNLYGYKILGNEKDLLNLRKKYLNCFIGVGQIKNPNIRIKLFNLLKKFKYEIPIIKSPFANISKYSTINEGTILMHNCHIGPSSKINSNCIINTSCIIEHDAIIGNNCHISTGAIINGSVKIGESTFVGSNAVIKEGIKVGKNCIIGAGCKVMKNIPNNSIIK